MTTPQEAAMREAFEAHWLKVRGAKKAKHELARHPLQPQVYIQDSANRHWVTWQAALAQHGDDSQDLTIIYMVGYAKGKADALAQQGEQQPVAWTHSCNALCINGLELWCDHCPHCGKPRTTHAEQWPPGLITDIVLTVTALHKEVDIGWSPDARSHLLRLSTSIGMLAAAPAPQPARAQAMVDEMDMNDRVLAAIDAESSAPQPAQGVPETSFGNMPASFAKWLQREMPAGTVIGDPAWWAPRIYKAASKYMQSAQPVAAVPSLDANWYVLDKIGMATLCKDREDALEVAAGAFVLGPQNGPYRVVQMVALEDAQPAAFPGHFVGDNKMVPVAWTDGKGYVTTSKTIAEHHAANGETMTPLVAPGCAHCTNPLFAGTKCKNCGRVAQPVGPGLNPLWVATHPDGLSQPVAAQPMTQDEYKRMTTNGAAAWAGVDPQQLRTGLVPLTDERVMAILSEHGCVGAQSKNDFVAGLRYGEAAHGIGVEKAGVA